MTDPLGLGARAVTKLGSAVAASYSRGRDERRQVYRRFQEAVVVYVMQIRDSRLSPEAMGLQPSERKPYIDALMKATTELAQALYEVRLVGNPGPIATAEALRQAISNSFDAAAARRENVTEDEANLYAQAMHAFTEACRRDLWYRPPWWQIWRVSWWRTRRGEIKNYQSEQARGALIDPGTQAHSPTRHDVAFGIGPIVGGESISNYFDAGIVRPVMGPVQTGRILQAGQIHEVVFLSGSPRDENKPKNPPQDEDEDKPKEHAG
jgi:hypothetical protein